MNMKTLNLTTLILTIIGGLNWGLVGMADFNLVTAIFGFGGFTRFLYILIGVSALYQLRPLILAFRTGEIRAERGVKGYRPGFRD